MTNSHTTAIAYDSFAMPTYLPCTDMTEHRGWTALLRALPTTGLAFADAAQNQAAQKSVIAGVFPGASAWSPPS